MRIPFLYRPTSLHRQICAACHEQPALVKVGKYSSSLCGDCYRAGRQPSRWRLWLLVAALIALIVVVVWFAGSVALALVVPIGAKTYCRGCGVEIWPGTKYCASCRNSR